LRFQLKSSAANADSPSSSLPKSTGRNDLTKRKAPCPHQQGSYRQGAAGRARRPPLHLPPRSSSSPLPSQTPLDTAFPERALSALRSFQPRPAFSEKPPASKEAEGRMSVRASPPHPFSLQRRRSLPFSFSSSCGTSRSPLSATRAAKASTRGSAAAGPARAMGSGERPAVPWARASLAF